jgi:hypothetical protein
MLKGQFANDVKKYTNISKQNRPWVLAMQKHPMQTHKAKAENGTVKHHDCQFLKNVVLFESRSQETVHQNQRPLRQTFCGTTRVKAVPSWDLVGTFRVNTHVKARPSIGTLKMVLRNLW